MSILKNNEIENANNVSTSNNLILMEKQIINGKTNNKSAIKKVLFSIPKPENENSPYLDLEKKFNIEVHFHSFIKVEGVSKAEFKLQKINIQNYSAIIFTSKNSVDHFFNLLKELNLKVSPLLKYFCLSESVALYLSKYIDYKKRKIFFAEESDLDKWNFLFTKHKNESFIFPYSNIEYKDLINCLENNNINYKLVTIYKIISNDLKQIFIENTYDIICFFTQGGVNSFFDNNKNYKKGDTKFCVLGYNTIKKMEEYGFNVDIKVPSNEHKSVYDALKSLLEKTNNK